MRCRSALAGTRRIDPASLIRGSLTTQEQAPRRAGHRAFCARDRRADGSMDGGLPGFAGISRRDCGSGGQVQATRLGRRLGDDRSGPRLVAWPRPKIANDVLLAIAAPSNGSFDMARQAPLRPGSRQATPNSGDTRHPMFGPYRLLSGPRDLHDLGRGARRSARPVRSTMADPVMHRRARSTDRVRPELAHSTSPSSRSRKAARLRHRADVEHHLRRARGRDPGRRRESDCLQIRPERFGGRHQGAQIGGSPRARCTSDEGSFIDMLRAAVPDGARCARRDSEPADLFRLVWRSERCPPIRGLARAPQFRRAHRTKEQSC